MQKKMEMEMDVIWRDAGITDLIGTQVEEQIQRRWKEEWREREMTGNG